MKTYDYKIVLSVALLLAVIGVLGIVWQQPWKAGASVAVGNQYQSTTTPDVADRTNLCPARLGMASSTTGTLSSVHITGYGAGELMLLDATTSDVNRRTDNIATSSIRLINFPITATSSWPDIDVEFKRGLFVDYTTGVGTSTITYRC